MVTPADIPQQKMSWKRAARIVPSRFPPINPFERIADTGLTDALAHVESLTNDRLRDAAGIAPLVSAADRVSGPGTTAVMAAFTHIRPNRFNDDTFGAFYVGRELDTAVAETCFGREKFLRDAGMPATQVEMRVYYSDIEGNFHNLAGLRAEHPAMYDPNSYSESQPFGVAVHASGGDGVHYESVRHQGGFCLCVMRPKLISRCVQGEHLLYRWNGNAIIDWAILRTI